MIADVKDLTAGNMLADLQIKYLLVVNSYPWGGKTPTVFIPVLEAVRYPFRT
jgi:hypothetical protein